ncbi:hypothetical protein PILCRDRAFT_231 [Piloderma croceum F 1598]|uniref:Uncharacterized protein n=1 Tax=Piloderma croceum (strain F 1598) TaxID=765440 RepID=A0A0C3GKM4_PILCF|nr:hypothetical protein PILCRDRAFT_231 [Piloderma croceum F 1598]
MASVEKHGTSVDRISTSKRIDFTTMIPTELITEIFLYCLPDEIYIDPHIREAPLLLGQICRSWRSIALHTPKLWSSVAIKVKSTHNLRRLLFQPFPVGPNVNLQDITIPWAQLTHIMLPCELLTSSPISLLRQCPRLMECVLFRSGPLYDDSLKHLISPFVLPDLRPLRIELEVHSMETLADFFDALVLPTLRTLTIKYGHSNNNEWPQSNFISLLSRSLCHLESLTLIGIRPSEEAVIRILQMTTASLTTLEIDTGFTGICLTDRTLDLLTAHDPLSDQEPHECLAPNLTRLSLYRCVSSTDRVLSKMVHSRRRGGTSGIARLITLQIDTVFLHNHPKDDWRILQLADNGLEILRVY